MRSLQQQQQQQHYIIVLHETIKICRLSRKDGRDKNEQDKKKIYRSFLRLSVIYSGVKKQKKKKNGLGTYCRTVLSFIG